MSSDADLKRVRDWRRLYDRIVMTLDRFGRMDAFGEGDYWLLDEDWGLLVHQIEFQNLKLLRPAVINSLQALLAEFSEWVITVRVDVVGKEKAWPGMGLIIRPHDVIDELRRDYLPEEFQQITFGTE